MNERQMHELIREIRQEIALRRNLALEYSGPDLDRELMELIETITFEKAGSRSLNPLEIKAVVDAVFNQMRRLDVIEPFIHDREITEIMINGPDKIFIEKNGVIQKTDVRFESRERLEDIIQVIVGKVNRSVNEAEPIVDARLEDGSRVNVVLPPIALNGPIVTIRKFPEKPMTIEDLIRYESITHEAAEFLDKLVKSKYNIFICGGTGSGKTSFLNALSSLIPPNERIVTIEDSAELQLSSIENLVRLETRNANTEGKGEIRMKSLIRTSLRMRPERIIVGEVRGEEALDMLQAMNTGHDGSMSTGHANSTRDMLSRLETMVLMAAPLPLDAIRKQIASALDIMIFLSRLRDHSRRTMEISEVLGYKDGVIELNPLFAFEYEGEAPDGRVIGRLKRTGNSLVNQWKAQIRGITF
ncbi:MAG TPA: CpaF family protein [Thermoclostridium caenicola]|uniref:Pilus assembly protein CpaF n=1 Tax=Thermoclostridium caenicola TaxID=659425 RepID=A0A1M6GIQ3_9FIRM|nr:CpaF family protein [Thermoclostridium caenicola]SHJ09791.1 pilus assembly protein CpaF [Thermoclostridium caenicola]HOK42073.1 CpaF family protein [Thermoclostridium caenicola]HOP71810.1 CpaF family protein [Thermoclostridium caenicola]HPO75635.1 CpaF family protein [Thermoclostridium caenicola]